MRPDPSGQLAAYLASNRNFVVADVWTFATVYGEILRCSGYTVPLTIPASMFDVNSTNAGSNVVFALGPRFGRTKTSTKIGLQVDSLDMQIYTGVDDSVGNLTWQNAFRLGVFDQATIELGRVVCRPLVEGLSPVGYVVWFKGLVGEVSEIGRTSIRLKLDSTLTLLSTQYPRRLWQATCSHVFGDAMCQFDRNSLSASAQAQAGTTQIQVAFGFTPNPYNLFDLGTVVGASGANTNYKRSIYSVRDGIAALTVPFVYPIAVGDYFYLLPGCDHTIQSCINNFNNLAHYGGQPYIPNAEFSI